MTDNDLDTTPSTDQPPSTGPSPASQHGGLTRRRLLVGALGGAAVGAIAANRLGAVFAAETELETALDQLSDPSSALEPAERLGEPPPSTTTTTTTIPKEPIDTAPPELMDVPEGKLMFPVLPSDDCFVLDNFGDARGCCRLHEGIDIMGSRGQPVFATADGVLTQRYTNTGTAGWGWKLDDEDNDVVYKYFHLMEDDAGWVEGDTVRRGDVIGYVGKSGTFGVDNYHLHYEYRPGNVAVDPLPMMHLPGDACGISDPLRA